MSDTEHEPEAPLTVSGIRDLIREEIQAALWPSTSTFATSVSNTPATPNWDPPVSYDRALFGALSVGEWRSWAAVSTPAAGCLSCDIIRHVSIFLCCVLLAPQLTHPSQGALLLLLYVCAATCPAPVSPLVPIVPTCTILGACGKQRCPCVLQMNRACSGAAL